MEVGEFFYEDVCQIFVMSDVVLEKVKGIVCGMNGSLLLGIISFDVFYL